MENKVGYEKGKEDVLSIQHAVHDILEERFEGIQGRLVIGLAPDGEAEEENARQQRGEGNGTFAANVLNVHSITRNDRSWHTNNGRDSVISIHNGGRGRSLALTGIGEILGQEGVEKGVAHTDCGPAEPE